jgi:hypothetical protein
MLVLSTLISFKKIIMKKYSGFILIFGASAGLLWSCSKDLKLTGETTTPRGFAYIKIAHGAPNFRGVVNNRDSFNVFVNGAKLNGSFLTYGSYFPSTTNLYATVPAGTAAIKLTVNGVNTPDSLALATLTKTLTAGSYYSLIMTDSVLTLNEAKQIFVQDNFSLQDTLHYSVRLVHAMLNDSAGKNIDIYSSRQAANLYSNISPGTVTSFSTQNYTLVTDTLIVRRAGTTFELARANAVVFARERVFTLVYRGLPGVAPGGTKSRILSLYNNQ